MKALRRKILARGEGKHIELWPNLKEHKRSPAVEASFSKVMLNVQNGVEFIDPLTVTHLEAHSNYTKIHCLNGRRVLISKTLKSCSTSFPATFLRVHQTYLVNPQFIQSYLRQDQQVRLDNGLSLPVSRTGKKVMQDFLRKAACC